jgi:aspartate aminotransferase
VGVARGEKSMHHGDTLSERCTLTASQARSVLLKDGELGHEYLPIEGLALYLKVSQRLVFGTGSAAIVERRVASVQTLSGTGALFLGFLFLSRFLPASDAKRVYVSDPPYVNHVPILRHAGLETGSYPYYNANTRSIDFGSLRETLSNIPEGSTILLHVCAHNPTGTDLSAEQWKEVAQIMKTKHHIPFFDSAYQGFASGDPESDAWPVRYFVDQRFDVIMVAQSYAKTFGLYGERTGCLHIVASSTSLAANIFSQLRALQRVTVSTPPAFGARVVSTIPDDEKLEAMWREDLETMAGRIAYMRHALRDRLEALKTPGQWDHITSQIGMFCYSGLTAEQVDVLRDVHQVYMTKDGRMSVAGLNASNVDYVAGAIRSVIG